MKKLSKWLRKVAISSLFGCLICSMSVEAEEKYDYVVTDAVYGVNATDKVSDAKALNTLFEKAIGSQEMVTFYFPAGTYYIDKTLKIYSNTHLILHEDAVIYRMDSLINKNMLRNADQNKKQNATGGYDMSKNIIIEGGTWNGGDIKKATNNAVVLRIDHAENVTIKNCSVKNVYDCHLITLLGVKNGVITNCKLSGFRYKKGKEKNYNYAREAIQLESAWTDNESDLDDSSAYWAQGTVIDGTYCQQVSVTNNQVIDMPCGIGQHHFTKSGKYRNKDITISDNEFKCSTDMKYCKTAITCAGMDNLTVSGNTIEGPYRFGMRVEGATNVMIENNDLKKISRNGIVVAGGKQITIRNNTMKNVKNSGISLTGGQVDLVTNNSATTIGSHGIFVGKCKVTTITQNEIIGTKQNGLCISSSTITNVTQNTFKNSSKHGISVTGSKKAGSVKNISSNTIYNTKLNGVSVNGGKVTNLSKNKITKTKGHGISVIDGTVGQGKKKDKGIQKNTIKDCKKNGISVSKKGVVSGIAGNKVSKIKFHGISMSENAKVYWVIKNTTKKCGRKGINNRVTKVKVKVKNNKGQS